MRALAVLLFSVAASLVIPDIAFATVTQKDLEIAGNLLGFTIPPFAGTVRLGIIYADGNAGSRRELEAMVALLGTGLKLDDVTLVPVPIEADHLNVAAADVFFVPMGLSKDGAKIGAFIRIKKVLCLTTDWSEVEEGHCTLSIQSEPFVKINVSKAVEEATGAHFDPAFRMMISEN